ncbi:Dolichyl-phosphate-mannose-protein mannosyltransferase [Planctomycetes bacterium Pan216]|uniref:Dolichyl-phosphate-mannose-protein mannosyltransferase n=1 Tax=Kolteria novifilia TaxID=2527975 RepID=A0A518BAP9_9BACT|nr:Dolichyl-phosphate-mannose-protein mannosyltransferase [Planctomycetes bacterium Pan216]
MPQASMPLERPTEAPGEAASATRAVLVLIAATAAFRILTGSFVGLGYGESYHFACAIRPSLGYFDHPPMSLWLGWLGLKVAGTVGPLAVRAPFIIMFAGTTWLMYAIGRRLFGSWSAFYAVLLLNFSAVFTLSVGTFLQPDGPLMFFWVAAIAALVKVFFDDVRRPTAWWAMVGLMLGLAMLSKYHAVFLVMGTVIYVVTRREQLHWLWHPGPYIALIIAAALFTPVLLWNQQNEWISFLWQGNRGLDYKGLRWDWLARNIGGQALWLLPWIWLPLVYVLMQCWWRGPKDRIRWFIASLATIPIVLFTVISVYAPIGFHFHWQAPGYLLLFLPLGEAIDRRLREQNKLTRYWMGGTVLTTSVALIFLTSHAATGWWRDLGPTWLSEKFGEPDDPTLECLDYKPLERVLADKGLLDRDDIFVFTNRWFQSGKVDYALKGKLPVACFSGDPRSFAFFENPEQWVGNDGILVSTKKFLDDPNDWYRDYFQRIEPLEEVPVYRGKHAEETLYLYRCVSLKQAYPNPYR